MSIINPHVEKSKEVKKGKENNWNWKLKEDDSGDNKRKEDWKFRPVVLKKLKPDPVLTQFFTAVKSKKAIHHHNHQGFPKKQCWFATNLDGWYYVQSNSLTVGH